MGSLDDKGLDPSKVERAKIHQERVRAKKEESPKGIESYHLVEGKKVVKRTKMPSGNVYSEYVGTKAEADANKLKYTKD